MIQNSGGTAITLANDVTIRRINVGTSSGDGISGTNVNTADIGGSSTISGVTGADLKLSGGDRRDHLRANDHEHRRALGRHPEPHGWHGHAERCDQRHRHRRVPQRQHRHVGDRLHG